MGQWLSYFHIEPNVSSKQHHNKSVGFTQLPSSQRLRRRSVHEIFGLHILILFYWCYSFSFLLFLSFFLEMLVPPKLADDPRPPVAGWHSGGHTKSDNSIFYPPLLISTPSNDLLPTPTNPLISATSRLGSPSQRLWTPHNPNVTRWQKCSKSCCPLLNLSWDWTLSSWKCSCSGENVFGHVYSFMKEDTGMKNNGRNI